MCWKERNETLNHLPMLVRLVMFGLQGARPLNEPSYSLSVRSSSIAYLLSFLDLIRPIYIYIVSFRSCVSFMFLSFLLCYLCSSLFLPFLLRCLSHVLCIERCTTTVARLRRCTPPCRHRSRPRTAAAELVRRGFSSVVFPVFFFLFETETFRYVLFPSDSF